MKRSWILIVLLLILVAIFSVQNADVITVRFLAWDITMSAALVIQLAALLGGLVGLAAGVRARKVEPASELPPATSEFTDGRALPDSGLKPGDGNPLP